MQENLLDSHEFLSWLVQRVDHIKPTDTKTNPYFPLMLYLPLVLKVSVVMSCNIVVFVRYIH